EQRVPLGGVQRAHRGGQRLRVGAEGGRGSGPAGLRRRGKQRVVHRGGQVPGGPDLEERGSGRLLGGRAVPRAQHGQGAGGTAPAAGRVEAVDERQEQFGRRVVPVVLQRHGVARPERGVGGERLGDPPVAQRRRPLVPGGRPRPGPVLVGGGEEPGGRVAFGGQVGARGEPGPLV